MSFGGGLLLMEMLTMGNAHCQMVRMSSQFSRDGGIQPSSTADRRPAPVEAGSAAEISNMVRTNLRYLVCGAEDERRW